MASYNKKILLFFSILVVIVLSYTILIYTHPELVDEAYARFTTPKASSMILGTSRSSVGIVPSIMNTRLFNGENKMVNHSFSYGTSNYGPRYLKEIKQKIKITGSHNGIFIVCINPWALSIDKDCIDDTTSFIEDKNNIFVGGLASSSVNPNYEYLKKYWGNRFNPILTLSKKIFKYEGTWLLNKDGWLEINVNCDPFTVNHRIQQGFSNYLKFNLKLSEARFNYLGKIIEFLKNEGTVYIIRMPVTEKMRMLEFDRYPEFNNRILALSNHYNVRYFNFINSTDYSFVDIHHLQKKSAFAISGQICDSILNIK